MTQLKRARSKKRVPLSIESLEWPIWYDPLSPFGSAVRYVASLSPKFTWVGIEVLRNGKVFKLGPFLGSRHLKPQSEMVVLIQGREGKILGQIKSQLLSALDPKEEGIVRKVAEELGELWPE